MKKPQYDFTKNKYLSKIKLKNLGSTYYRAGFGGTSTRD